MSGRASHYFKDPQDAGRKADTQSFASHEMGIGRQYEVAEIETDDIGGFDAMKDLK